MKYQNPGSGVSIDLSELDQERKRFYRAALEKSTARTQPPAHAVPAVREHL